MKTTKEVWKKVDENRRSEYYVSNMGRCKQIVKQTGEATISHGYLNAAIGYRMLNRKYIHRLVAEAFIPNPNNYEQVDHLNNDRVDNRVENLRWSSRKMNNSTQHARKERSKNASRTQHSDQIIMATKDGQVQYFKNGKNAAQKLGCSHVLVYNVIAQRGSARKAKGWILRWIDLSDIDKMI